jgi:hypothetical protein
LKSQVEAAIRIKVTERRREIEAELSRLTRFEDNGRAKVVTAETKAMIAVKYRNPRSTPKTAKKLDKSLVAERPKASKPKQAKKIRKARKTRKPVNNRAPVLSILPAAEHVEALPVEALPVGAPPVEAVGPESPPVASIHANDIPAEVSVAA